VDPLFVLTDQEFNLQIADQGCVFNPARRLSIEFARFPIERPMQSPHGSLAREALTGNCPNSYLSSVTLKEQIMSDNRKRSSFAEIISVMGDALAVAASVRQGRQPKAHNLLGLGIDPEQFRQIRRF